MISIFVFFYVCFTPSLFCQRLVCIAFYFSYLMRYFRDDNFFSSFFALLHCVNINMVQCSQYPLQLTHHKTVVVIHINFWHTTKLYLPFSWIVHWLYTVYFSAHKTILFMSEPMKKKPQFYIYIYIYITRARKNYRLTSVTYKIEWHF